MPWSTAAQAAIPLASCRGRRLFRNAPPLGPRRQSTLGWLRASCRLACSAPAPAGRCPELPVRRKVHPWPVADPPHLAGGAVGQIPCTSPDRRRLSSCWRPAPRAPRQSAPLPPSPCAPMAKPSPSQEERSAPSSSQTGAAGAWMWTQRRGDPKRLSVPKAPARSLR